jgi:putative hydrolase of the HAD superfamily
MRRLIAPVRRPRLSRREKASGPVWLFDLDNTLHDASAGMFASIDICMTRAVMITLGVDEETAQQLRRRYWWRYGATLIGMVRHHGVDPHEFLHHSHDFDIESHVHVVRGLRQLLRRLPGRKVLFTNAPEDYARRVIKRIGIAREFEALWAVEQMRLQGQFAVKPSARLMRQVLAREGIAAHKVILVEDTPVNLKGAWKAGIGGVLVRHPETPFVAQRAGRPVHIARRVRSIQPLLARPGVAALTRGRRPGIAGHA